MGGKAGGKVQVSDHYMSMHIGICAAGEGLEILAINAGEKEAWRGRIAQNTIIDIDQPDLFGGNKKEGGIRGLAWILNGNAKQILPEPLAQRLGLTSATCPGYRGIASIFFTGYYNPDAGETPSYWANFLSLVKDATWPRGFLWSSNNPYLKAISVRVRRPSRGLNPSIALIRMPDDSNGNEQWASNPAHIIFECMTNRDWGMGESFGAFNIGSYEQAAQILYDEGFGLNMIWTRQTKIENFIKEVLDHIQGAQFVDPATGKHTLKLLRAVDPALSVPIISPDNALMSNFKMKLWGEISNEVVVTWTNPETSKEETVTAQDLAAISMQGSQPASDARNYYGIPSQSLAIFAAERDLATAVHPIATCDVEVTKEFWKTVIHDVVELNWPEREIESVFFRVSQPSLGANSNTVKLSLYEDIFSLSRANYLSGNNSQWQNPSQPPEPLVYYQTGTAPAFIAAAALDLNDPSELVYPEVVSGLVVGPDTPDDVDYELVGYVSNAAGQIVQQSFGNRTFQGSWATTVPIVQEAETTLPNILGFLGSPPEVGGFVLFGDGADATTEIALVTAIGESGYVLQRGVLDTVPKNWATGTRAFFIQAVGTIPDTTRRAAFETASYHFRTRTSLGLLPIADAPQIDVTLSERPYLPNRPANVQVSGVGFGTADLGTAASIPVTWSRRDRTNESTQVMFWTDGDMVPEAGQTTSIIVMDMNRTPITTIAGLTGTSYNLTRSNLGCATEAIVRVIAVRDNLNSLQGHEINVTITFSPACLFANGEPGVWYDPSDLSTLFQDAAASVPASAPGHPVGRIKDKSGNGNDAVQSVAAARPILARVPVGGARNIARHSTADIFWKAEGTHPPTVLLQQSHLGHSCAAISFAAGTPAGFSVSRADRAIAGVMHPITPGVTYAMSSMISLSRQLTGGERVTVYQTGSGASNYLNLDAGNTAALVNAWLRVDHPVTVADGVPGLAYPVVFVSQALGAQPLTVYIRDIQIEVGASATAYQRTTTIHDVTQEGLRDCWYLSFDGVDDFMVTPTITPGIDKVQVFAGVRKLSDAATMAIAETSENPDANVGVLSLASVATSGNSFFRSKGTIQGDTNAVPSVAPITRIVSGLGDISGNRTTLRVDGAQVAQSTSDQGTGNFLAYPIYIGARAGTSNFFNGHLYSLVTRFGPNLDAPVIGKTETYVAGKTGVTL